MMTTNDPKTIHLSVDIRQDLSMASDPTYQTLNDFLWEGDFDQTTTVEGVTVDYVDVAEALRNYVTAWEQTWVATAALLGYDAIATGDASITAEHDALNDPDSSDCSVVDAWQTTWDACPPVHFTAEMLP